MIQVVVVYCPAAGEADLTEIALADGATIRDALAASGLVARHDLAIEGQACGVWGRRLGLEHVLRARDRVEVYRPLLCDPKEARRLRYRQRKERDKAAAVGAISGNPTR